MRIDGLGTTQATGESAKVNPKLVDGAHQFEAMMLQEMLKPLKFGETESEQEENSSGGGQSDMIRGFATEALAKAISNGGGFGIAKQIIRQVTAEQTAQSGKHGKAP